MLTIHPNPPVDGAHVWVAAIAAVVALALATLLLCGFSPTIIRKLVIGEDERASTSKFQAAAWTYAISFALLTLFFGQAFYADFDPGWNIFLDSGLNSDYLWLLGIPSVGLAGAKVITQTKAADDPAAKPPKTIPTTSLMTRVRELGTDDNDADPQPALADLQYLIFNAIALLYFLGAFLSHVEAGLPSLPDSLIALTGVSAASYLATKAAAKSAAPAIVSVQPRTVRLGPNATPLVISGTGFIPPSIAGTPTVMLGGVNLAVDPGATATQITANIPTAANAATTGLKAGTLDLVVLTPVGTPSPEPAQVVVSEP
jgi:hypothetical protein